MFKGVIRLLAFFTKEINEVRRQPRLVLALIFGPFIILLLFGLGYQASPPRPRLALVIPDSIAAQMDVEGIKVAANATYEVVAVTNDENAAMGQLDARQADVVEILPADAQARLESGEPAPVTFRYAEVNPLNETWIQSLGYAQVNEMNKALLLQTTMRLQQEARTNQDWVSSTRQELDTLTGDANESELAARQASIRRLKVLVSTANASPLFAAQLAANGQDANKVKQELTALAQDLDALDQAITNHTLGQEQGRLATVRDRLATFDEVLKAFGKMPPQVIVSPLAATYENARGQALSLSIFYAPGVLALLLQHIAVTLGALSLVRERLLGAVELFRVAPVSTRQILFGKYLAYFLFIAVLAAVLTLAMIAMQVPFRGNLGAFAGVIALLIVASLGIGFLISIVSKSDTQAVQLSMLVLLLSIFFSGFFLPLENFWAPIRAVGYLLPLTPGIMGLQDILLRGFLPSTTTWLLIGANALITLVLVMLLAGRQLRFSQS